MSSGLPKPGTLIPPPKNSVTSVTSAQPAPTQPSDKTAAEASTAAEAARQAAAQASNMSLSAYASLSDFDKILVPMTATNRKMEKLDSRVDIIDEKTDEHIEETNRKFQNTEERLEKLQAQIDGIMAGDVTVQPSVSEELRMEKDKFERTVGLEPVELTQEETPEEQAAMDLACYYGALRKLGIPQIQLDKFNILRVFRTANTGHPLRMYAEFETSGPVRVINRLVGNRQGIKIQPWVASQLIYDMYEPLSTLAYNLRLYRRENGKKIWTQIMFMDNVLRLELAMEGVEGRHFLPLTINNTAEAVSFISNKGTGAQRKRRRSEVRPPSPLLSNEHRVHWAEAGEAREERRPLTEKNSSLEEECNGVREELNRYKLGLIEAIKTKEGQEQNVNGESSGSTNSTEKVNGSLEMPLEVLELRKQIEKQSNDLGSSTRSITELRGKVTELEDKLMNTSRDLHGAQDLNQALQHEYKEIKAQKDDQEERIATLEKRYLNSQREASQLHDINERLEQEIKNKNDQIALYQEKIKAINEKLDLSEQKLIEYASMPDIEEQLKDRMEALAAAQERQGTAEEHVRTLENAVEEKNSELNRLSQRLKMNEEHNQRLSSTVDKLLTESNERLQVHLKERMLALEEKNNLSNDLQSTKKKLEEFGNQKVEEPPPLSMTSSCATRR